MPVTEQTYQRVALEDPEGQWELHRGRLREKPPMSIAHNRLITRLAGQLIQQLDDNTFEVRVNLGRTRRADEIYYIPDVAVVPADPGELPTRPDALEVFDAPLPLVVEVWSPSTGGYDIDTKIPEYEKRGDIEIWRFHPYERTLTVRRRQPDGSYETTQHRAGVVRPVALPEVTIDLDVLWRGRSRSEPDDAGVDG